MLSRKIKNEEKYGTSKKLAMILASSLFSFSAFAGDLYVSTSGNDSNSGTLSAPLRTIQKASNMAGPGTTVHVAAGEYAESIATTNSGTASAHIRFVSDTKWAAKIVPAASAYTMWSVSGAYVDIDGFQIYGAGSNTVRIGISLTGGNSSVKNSWAHHIAQTSGCDNKGGAALLANQAGGSTHIGYDFENNLIHDVGGGCGWIQGIYHQSTGNIKNNLVYACSQAVDMGHDAHNINVVNNTFFGNSGYAVYFGGCKEAYNNGCPTSGIKIYNNIFFNNYGGVQGPIATEDVGNELKNNLVYGNQINFDLAAPSTNTRSGEVNADPQFVNYIRTGGGDYHLKSTSPVINRGLASLSTSTAPATDFDGKARNDGAIDLGAFEYGAVAQQAPDVSFSPSSVSFPQQLVGTTSSVLLVTMKNTGNANLDGTKAWSVSGDFAFGGAGTCGSSLAPGATCVISFVFKPTASGVRSGKFTMLDNTALGTHSIALSGSGSVSAQSTLSLSKSSLIFAAQKVGTRSTVQSITLKNAGSAPLSFPTSFTISGDFSFSGGTCQVNVAYAPGATCTFGVMFKPRATGARSGYVTIPSNASATPATIQLSGSGI